jgi:hypothetical protein
MLEKGEGDLGEQGMMMQPAPRAPLVVIEPQLLFHLLVALFTDPARLEQPDQRGPRGGRRQILQVVLPLAAGTTLAHDPRARTVRMASRPS